MIILLHPHLLNYYKLDAGASDARSHDTHKMTSLVAELVNTIIPAGEAKLSEHPGAESRAERGLQNKYTGRLLTDIASNWDDPAYVPPSP